MDNASLWGDWLTGPVSPPVLADVRVDANTPPDTLYLVFLSSEVLARRRSQSARAAYGAPLRIGPATFRVASRQPVGNELAIAVLPRDVAVDQMLAQLAVVPVTGTDALQVKFTDTDPALAQQVVNLVVRNFCPAPRARRRSRRVAGGSSSPVSWPKPTACSVPHKDV